MKRRVAIYTVLAGNSYDSIKQFDSISDDVDYICFVKKGQKNKEVNGIWRVEEIDYDAKDNGRLSRYPKLQPHKTFLSDYEYSLYIDGNIIIKNDYVYQRIDELINCGTKIALLKHPFRDCVYQEAYVCIASMKGGWLDILRQIFFLKRNSIPKHNGLYEANVIFRKHNDADVIAMDELWWETFMKYSKRDQLSLVYALSKYKGKIDFFLPPGQTTRNHPSFEKISHLPQKPSTGKKVKHFIIKLLSGVARKALKE